MPFALSTPSLFLTTLIMFIFQFVVSIATSLLLYLVCCKASITELPRIFTNFVTVEITECAYMAYLINWPVVVLTLYYKSYPSFSLLSKFNFFFCIFYN